MPNWVYNQIKIKSDNPQEYGYIKETLKDNGPDKVTDFSFNKVITRPADKEEDWYNWNISNWGTKWDASDVAFFERDNLLIYEFSTAWSPPEPVIVKLSKLFPNCDIEHIYEEEQGWGGELEFVNGMITAESDYENKCRDCDSDNTMEYCENDCGEICSECNWLGEADLDCVAECQTHMQYLDSEHVPDYRLVTNDN